VLQVPPSSDWTLRFVLKPWRRAEGELDERELSVCKLVSHERLSEYMDLVDPYDVILARVHFEGELRATLIELMGAEADEELERRAAELQEPITMEVDSIGTLTFDRHVGWWETERVWAGTAVRLWINVDEGGDVAAVAKTADALWASESEWDERLRARAVDELLALKNENWRAEDEAEVTSDEFKQRMKPEGVTVAADGEVEFSFEDGELFLGHAVRVWGNLTDGPTDADIAG
jgi:hypothetical protein